MKFKARILVRLKGGMVDPEGETIKKSLMDLNFPVIDTRLGKVYDLGLEAKTIKDAETLARLMCTRLLANPVKDEYELLVEREDGSSISGEPAA